MTTQFFGIAVGDPSGIGPSIALKAAHMSGAQLPCILYGDEQVLRAAAATLPDKGALHLITSPADAVPGRINVIHVTPAESTSPSSPRAACGMAAHACLERAVAHAMSGQLAAVVACPVSMDTLAAAGQHAAGHSELFAELTAPNGDKAGCVVPTVLLTGGKLRVMLVSTHVPLRVACDRATRERILRTIRLAHQTTRELTGNPLPRLAVTGLNPHCGRGHVQDSEEQTEIIPAINDARGLGLNVCGPVAADTAFEAMEHGAYDLIVAMYHDQGIIPLRRADCMDGVHITLGLPIICTAVARPAHPDATADGMQLPTPGEADISALLAALHAAQQLAQARSTPASPCIVPQCVIVADDLTGASDTGVQFLKHGFATTVTLREPDLTSPAMGSNVQALVLDSESRNIPASEAAAKVTRLATGLVPCRGSSIIYKKVDSTMRGNLAAETRALRDVLGFRHVVFTSAFPTNGRIVRNDILYLDGVPVAETSISRDPLKPVHSSSPCAVMADIDGQDSTLAPQALTLDDIRTPGKVAARLAQGGVFCCDAEQESDLHDLVRGVLEAVPAHDVLWVGSAGLAGALLHATGASPTGGQAKAETAAKRTNKTAPAILVVGSVHQKNRDQVAAVLAADAATLLTLELHTFLTNPDAEQARLFAEASALLGAGKNLLLATTMHDGDIRQGHSLDVAQFMGRLTRSLLATSPVRGIFLTGGDTAVTVLNHLDCSSARIEQEVEIGVPLIRLNGGACPELAVITKAGAFGNAQTMLHCLEVL